MEIVGGGFLAGALSAIGDRHPDAVVFAAGVSSTGILAAEEFEREAALLRRTLHRCARQDRTLVYLSTASHAMYGNTSLPAGEDAPVDPRSPYGRHKLAMERELAASPARWLVPRLSHVTGPGQRPHQLLPAFVAQARSGTLRIQQGAHRDLVDVEDVVRAVDGLLALGVCGEVVNVASGVPFPVATIAEGVARRLGAPARHRIVAAPPVSTRVSIEKLRRLLPALRPLGDPGYLDRLLDRYVPCY